MKPNQLLYVFLYAATFLFALLSCNTELQKQNSSQAENPEIVTKPFTRWWWMGNAVTKQGITNELEAFKAAGLGGVEITPIHLFLPVMVLRIMVRINMLLICKF